MVDVLLDHTPAHAPEFRHNHFVWPFFQSKTPETITFHNETAIPAELRVLPPTSRQLIFFGDFFLAYDEQSECLGVLRKTNAEFENGEPTHSDLAVSFDPELTSLQQEYSLIRPLDNFPAVFNHLPEFLKPDGLYYQLKPENFPPHHQLNFDELIHLQYLLSTLPECAPAVKSIFSKAGYLAPGMLMHISTASELESFAHAAQILPREKLHEIAENNDSIQALKLDIAWEDDEGRTKPGYQAFQGFSHALTREIFLDMINNPDIDNEVVQKAYALSFQSLAAIGYLACDPEIADQLFASQTQADQEHTADAFARIIADEKARSSLPLVPVVMFWTQRLGNYAPSGMTPEATIVFYEALTNLNNIADETTGDTDQELRLFKEQLSALDLPKDFSWLDAGSGDGKRILRPLLEWFRSIDKNPRVVAADLLPYDPPEDGAWATLQADIADPAILDRIPSGEVDLVTLAWSVLNDLPKIERQQSLENLNRALKLGRYIAFDVTVDYQDEEAAYRERNPQAPPGSFTRDFPGPDGTPVEKGFQASRPAVLEAELAKAGFIAPKRIPYTTKAGYHRLLVIAQKTGDPIPDPPKPWKKPVETTN